MRRKEELPELLAPAGDFECLVAAVEGGADAIYVGAKRFGARAYAKNFDNAELSRAVTYCHLHGVRLYVTVNTLIYDREMDEVVELARELYEIGVDAIIIADLGAIAEIRRHVPGLELHASTQMSVHNSLGADEAYKLGCTRVVLARELSGEDIAAVTAACRAEVEVFLHGALCVCHSGQCLFSSLVGGRSGNRGECAQPCRLPYNGDRYPLSLSDLSLANHIGELIESGVASLKIEGRMKSPDYVYTVTSIYRRLLDEHRPATKKENDELARVFSRGGFTDGYFRGTPSVKMTGTRSEADKENSRNAGGRVFEIRRRTVRAEVSMRLGEPSRMTLTDGVKSVSVIGEIPAVAANAPLTRDSVAARLSKMGNTFLSLSEENIKIELDEGINLPPSAINALRRAAAEAFEDQRRVSDENCEKRDTPPTFSAKKPEKMRTALFLRPELYREICELTDDFDAVFLPLHYEGERASGVYLPPVITEHELDSARAALARAADGGVRYALVGNIGHIPLVRECGMIAVGDFRLNITNSATAAVYGALGVERRILSPELTLPQARDIGGEIITYGRIPLMLTERCFIKESFGCSRCRDAALTDRKGEKFPMIREHEHRNLILNSRVTYMGDRAEELRRAGLLGGHFIFSVETAKEAKEAIAAYKKRAPLTTADVRRVGKRKK